MGNVFGYEVECDRSLRRLRTPAGSRGTIRVAQAGPGILDGNARITAIESIEDASGHHVFVLGQEADRHVIGCSVTGGYRFDAEALNIETDPRGTPEMWEHRLLSVVIPMMLAARGDLVLHAAVIDVGGTAVILCGPAMRGKSTLALTFSQLGYPVLSEDGAVLGTTEDGWIVWPAAGGARIRAFTGGRFGPKVISELAGPEAMPLEPGAIVLMDPRGGDETMTACDPAEAILWLVPHLMHSGGTESFRPAFSRLAGLLGSIPAVRVSMPDDLDLLPDAAMGLARSLGNLEGGRPEA